MNYQKDEQLRYAMDDLIERNVATGDKELAGFEVETTYRSDVESERQPGEFPEEDERESRKVSFGYY